MKLLLCQDCGDVFSLTKVKRSCQCGETSGRYIDNLNAEYSGDAAIPLGFHNTFFLNAIHNQPESGLGKNFEAFVIPKECPTYKKI